jgi:hypothetical protein
VPFARSSKRISKRRSQQRTDELPPELFGVNHRDE